MSLKSYIYSYTHKFITHIDMGAKLQHKQPVMRLIILSVVLNLFLEASSRRSLIESIHFIISNPYMFFYNILIVLTTLLPSLLFLRRNFVIALISAIWGGIGIINFILLGFRTIPLVAIDLYIFRSVFRIINIYLSPLQIFLIIILFTIVLSILIWCWKKFPKHQVNFSRVCIVIIVLAMLAYTLPEISTANGFGNLVEAYDRYGFAYCFAASVIDRGISRPDEYSQEYMDHILSFIKEAETNIPDTTPNIIMLQLESFFDVNDLKHITFSENPVPNFTRLKRDFSSGYLTVPTVGAGTANTEFEVITGMKLKYFGLGEYPYKTILQSSTVETIGYNLGELGYRNHAIHNNTGTFYDRDIVFSNLGFHSFSSLEYMNDVEYTPNNWAKDGILTTEIFKALEATATQDFIYAISVQAHGKYPDEVIDENQRIKVLEIPEENQTIAYEYFINQLYEVDAFLGILTSELSSYKEPVVLVIFGDHLPSISIEDEDLENGDRFQTEYVIWSNFTMKQINCDLQAYQLSAYVMERLGFNNGLLTKLHQAYSSEESYEDNLVMLQYDMLYGDKYVYDGVNPYPKTDIQMGTSKITITEVSQMEGSIYVRGLEFTPWSVIYIDGKAKETLYIDKNTLTVVDEILEMDNSVFVAQVSPNKKILSKTAEWTSNRTKGRRF